MTYLLAERLVAYPLFRHVPMQLPAFAHLMLVVLDWRGGWGGCDFSFFLNLVLLVRKKQASSSVHA